VNAIIDAIMASVSAEKARIITQWANITWFDCAVVSAAQVNPMVSVGIIVPRLRPLDVALR